MFSERYARNKILNTKEQQLLKNSIVAVFGLGGLGGFVVEGLARMGVGSLVILDIDCFSETNLNRQRFCNEKNIGIEKSKVVKEELSTINSEVNVIAINKKLSENEIADLLRKEKVNLLIDCLDNKKDKMLLEKICSDNNLVMIHGAISGFVGQVATIYPFDNLLYDIYGGKDDNEDEFGNTSFTPMVVAGMQISEAVKFLTGKSKEHNKLICIDLKNNEFYEI